EVRNVGRSGVAGAGVPVRWGDQAGHAGRDADRVVPVPGVVHPLHRRLRVARRGRSHPAGAAARPPWADPARRGRPGGDHGRGDGHHAGDRRGRLGGDAAGVRAGGGVRGLRPHPWAAAGRRGSTPIGAPADRL
ncbi:MAG: hypothetical protein AVDCRST_MAG19-3337, partial [uncultured Thermomicrobiales bacterium]